MSMSYALKADRKDIMQQPVYVLYTTILRSQVANTEHDLLRLLECTYREKPR